jgi:hypothetical protein
LLLPIETYKEANKTQVIESSMHYSIWYDNDNVLKYAIRLA